MVTAVAVVSVPIEEVDQLPPVCPLFLGDCLISCPYFDDTGVRCRFEFPD